MSRWDKSKGSERGYAGAYTTNDMKLNPPGAYLDQWLRQGAYKDISGKVEAHQRETGGFSGPLRAKGAGPDHYNRAQPTKSKYPSRALGKEGNYRGVRNKQGV